MLALVQRLIGVTFCTVQGVAFLGPAVFFGLAAQLGGGAHNEMLTVGQPLFFMPCDQHSSHNEIVVSSRNPSQFDASVAPASAPILSR